MITDLSKAELKILPVNIIRRYEKQPRKLIDREFLKGLTKTTKSVGQPTPILVRPLEPPIDNFRYELIDGEQRWLACQKNGTEKIAAVVIRVKDENEQFLLSVIVNVQKSTLTPMEVAYAIGRLQTMGMSQREISRMFGKSQCWVHMRHAMLSLPPEALTLAGPETPEDNRLSYMQAYILVGLPTDFQITLAQRISAEQMSVTAARRLIAETVRDQKIKPIYVSKGNTSRLRLIEDVKKFCGFTTRADDYLEGLLSMENKKFQEIFRGIKVGEITRLKTTADGLSEKFKVLGECLEKIEQSMLSKGAEVEPASTPNIDPSIEQERKKLLACNGNVCSLKTIRLLKILGVPKSMLRPPQNNGKRRQKSYSSFWDMNINHLDILDTAKKNYKKRIVEVHPDKNNGSNSNEAAVLNQAWETIEQRFSLHGITLGK